LPENKLTVKGIVSDGVDICNKLTELPNWGKNLLLLTAATTCLYGATHINAAPSTEADTRYYHLHSTPATAISYGASSRTRPKIKSKTASPSTIPRTKRNLKLPITRNGITVGTLDYLVEDDGNIILDDSRIYISATDNPDERWIPFTEHNKIKGHYVGNDEDLTFRLNGREGIFADEDHQVLREKEDNSNNTLYLLGLLGAIAAGYGLSRISKRKKTEDSSDEEEITA
jgi:hypothetical protein